MAKSDIARGGAERRGAFRQRAGGAAEISNPTFGQYRVTVKDISDSGLFVELGASPMPPVGTELQVRFLAGVSELQREPMRARVVRTQGGGVGLALQPGI